MAGGPRGSLRQLRNLLRVRGVAKSLFAFLDQPSGRASGRSQNGAAASGAKATVKSMRGMMRKLPLTGPL